MAPPESHRPPSAPAVEPESAPETGKGRSRALLGAMFLMATSAIGPGFITQTATFTNALLAAFAFAILVSILIDIAVQLNVWRVIGVSGRKAQELGNLVFPGVGYVLAALVLIGGAIFNIGNVAGGGLGMNAMFGMNTKLGGAITAAVAIVLFLLKRAGAAIDRVVVILGAVMILLTLYVAIVSDPPVGQALRQSVWPDTIDFVSITTIVGGTVGGYITYAGAHRMLDAGVRGKDSVKEITRSSVLGVIITGVMRWVLFLALLGVFAGGLTLANSGNLAADAFGAAAGQVGLRLFGIVLWAASITSVIGAAYTSISFLTTFWPWLARNRNLATVAFIVLTSVAFLLLDTTPQGLLVFAGGFNGLILPIGLTVVLWVAVGRRDLLHGYRYPRWLIVIGVIAWAMTWFLAYRSIGPVFDLLSS